MKTALSQAVQRAYPDLSPSEVEQLLQECANLERQLVLKGLAFDQAREIARAQLFEGLDPWAGDEEYGPMP